MYNWFGNFRTNRMSDFRQMLGLEVEAAEITRIYKMKLPDIPHNDFKLFKMIYTLGIEKVSESACLKLLQVYNHGT